ncbi:hypothetical protein WSS_A34497 [Rhodococcus opacus M213]|uniref:Uncharacterized protein n=1 Tax=Rhodococcus opacus M213 TaxID=1129896 RepID=K8X974_RHOOP|nr:hypothetical protein [Rhodococcus opacus]EKT78033.1 hypothetical protein WSS_A34497 [Rhodococcus opacus M213]
MLIVAGRLQRLHIGAVAPTKLLQLTGPATGASRRGAQSRQERGHRQNEVADALATSGAVDDVLAKIDVGEVLIGDSGDR